MVQQAPGDLPTLSSPLTDAHAVTSAVYYNDQGRRDGTRDVEQRPMARNRLAPGAHTGVRVCAPGAADRVSSERRGLLVDVDRGAHRRPVPEPKRIVVVHAQAAVTPRVTPVRRPVVVVN